MHWFKFSKRKTPTVTDNVLRAARNQANRVPLHTEFTFEPKRAHLKHASLDDMDVGLRMRAKRFGLMIRFISSFSIEFVRAK